MDSRDAQARRWWRPRIPGWLLFLFGLGGVLVAGYGLVIGTEAIETSGSVQAYVAGRYAEICGEDRYACMDYGGLWDRPFGTWSLRTLAEIVVTGVVAIVLHLAAYTAELANKFTIGGVVVAALAAVLAASAGKPDLR